MRGATSPASIRCMVRTFRLQLSASSCCVKPLLALSSEIRFPSFDCAIDLIVLHNITDRLFSLKKKMHDIFTAFSFCPYI